MVNFFGFCTPKVELSVSYKQFSFFRNSFIITTCFFHDKLGWNGSFELVENVNYVAKQITLEIFFKIVDFEPRGCFNLTLVLYFSFESSFYDVRLI